MRIFLLLNFVNSTFESNCTQLLTINLKIASKGKNEIGNCERNEPKSGGKSTEFGAGDFISAAIGPRRAVGVHGFCLTPILSLPDHSFAN